MKSLTYRQLVRILKRNGFVLHHRRGSHHIYRHTQKQKDRIRTASSWQPAVKNWYFLSYYQTIRPEEIRFSEKVVTHDGWRLNITLILNT